MTVQRKFAYIEQVEHSEVLSDLLRTFVRTLASLLTSITLVFIGLDFLFQPERHLINEVHIQGEFKNITPQQIEKVVWSEPRGNFFAADLFKLRKQLEASTWVNHADVRRSWPDTLAVNVIEHQVEMRWQLDRWVNSDGAIVELPGVQETDDTITLGGDETYSGLILNQARAWRGLLNARGLSLRALSMSQSHAWSMKIQANKDVAPFDVFVGNAFPEERFLRFLEFYQQELMHQVQQLAYVDLRYPDGLAIKNRSIETMRQPPKPTR